MKAVLVGVDGSDGSRRAAAFAGNLARSFNAQLTVLHVVELPSGALADGIGIELAELQERLLSHGQEVLLELCRELDLEEAEQVLELGQAPESICAEAQARKVDMIVVGARGHGPHRMAAGSVGTRLVAMANQTVTIVR